VSLNKRAPQFYLDPKADLHCVKIEDYFNIVVSFQTKNGQIGLNLELIIGGKTILQAIPDKVKASSYLALF